MFNSLKSATPEQKLYTLSAELVTPIDIIRGYAYLIKKDIESNKIDPEDILKNINIIIETADKLKKVRAEIINA
ncbi:MAG TPA: hypothetical protein VK880_01450 [Anaerolineales bacterium]|nr:hypothetical protein [Anaerolineales bacterium]